jgi:hypothetical protein
MVNHNGGSGLFLITKMTRLIVQEELNAEDVGRNIQYFPGGVIY